MNVQAEAPNMYFPQVNGVVPTAKQAEELALRKLVLGARDFGTGQPVLSPLTVYRVEMPNGLGPYNSGGKEGHEIYKRITSFRKGYCCCNLAALNREQCGQSERRFYDMHGDASYCCDSIKSLRNWFPLETRQYLASKGAKVVQYVVPVGEYVAHCGHGELLINKKKAHRVCEEPLVD